MEFALTRYSRRPPDHQRGNNAPKMARQLLEENKYLAQEKQQTMAMERKNSREFVDALLAKDRKTTESDKALEVNRRKSQRQLAQYYKTKIAEKEMTKANAYQLKLESNVADQHFPFVEGENIDKNRKDQAATMRSEMRTFLHTQRTANPPRTDSLLRDMRVDHIHKYNLHGTSDTVDSDEPLVPLSGDEVAPHMARYPRFLSRAREHMSRRLHDEHVKIALDDKVSQTKFDLDTLREKRENEVRQWEDGMLANDALRDDMKNAKSVERRRVAQFLKIQMKERSRKDRVDLEEKRAEPIGYWGPEEKELQSDELHRSHCGDLIKQMQVNQQRRLDERNQRLRQERRLIDNSVAEMSQDRQKERLKAAQHKEVLTTTWKSQQKIRHAQEAVDAI